MIPKFDVILKKELFSCDDFNDLYTNLKSLNRTDEIHDYGIMSVHRKNLFHFDNTTNKFFKKFCNKIDEKILAQLDYNYKKDIVTSRYSFCHYKKGDFFTWHTDSYPNYIFKSHAMSQRIVSAIIFLSDPSDYEGGELQFNINDEISSHKLPVGSTVLFPGNVMHQVKKVMSGDRKMLIIFYLSEVIDESSK